MTVYDGDWEKGILFIDLKITISQECFRIYNLGTCMLSCIRSSDY